MLTLLEFLLLFQLFHFLWRSLIETINELSIIIRSIESKITWRCFHSQSIDFKSISGASINDAILRRRVCFPSSIVLTSHDALDFFDLVLIKIDLDLVHIHLVLVEAPIDSGPITLLSVSTVDTSQSIQIWDVLNVRQIDQLVHFVAGASLLPPLDDLLFLTAKILAVFRSHSSWARLSKLKLSVWDLPQVGHFVWIGSKLVSEASVLVIVGSSLVLGISISKGVFLRRLVCRSLVLPESP